MDCALLIENQSFAFEYVIVSSGIALPLKIVRFPSPLLLLVAA